jgi:acyl dehydratase
VDRKADPAREVTLGGLVPGPARLQRYLRTTRGEGVEPLTSGDLLPPVYPALWETALLLDLLRVSGTPLPRRGVIHRGGERIYLRAAAADEPHTLRVRLARTEPARRGVRLTIGSRLTTAAGRLCREGEIRLLLPGPRSDAAGDRTGIDDAAAADPRVWRDIAFWSFRVQDARRYARTSGDFNPVHLSWLTARLLGFPRPILHGFCTEATIAHALIERVCGGDPSALRRLRIDFPAPLLLPNRVVLQVADGEEKGRGYFRLAPALPDGRSYAEGEFVAGGGGHG